ncbi:MAG: DNA polymerase III subunit gamma/tau [Synergistes sp.]|nr:DNA polymerase III subunit gamma/tau [Synergistes sp.]
MYISLYRRYRPQTFSDVVGQGTAVGVLLEALREGTVSHAYLFSGPRGCGKTTAARLVAKSLNCTNRKDNCEPCEVCENCRAIASGEHLDVIEIDGATNRGIDEIRDLKSRVSLKALSGAYKVYIIDEVHMLTDQAFNALLKTLEEPPANVMFILATTEPNKVPVTIRSRCQHIPFHRITASDIVSRLKYICERENIASEDEALWEVARQADGALRDALSVMEQAIVLGGGSLTAESIKELTGGGSRSELEKWVTMLRTDQCAAAVTLHSIMARGISPERLCEALFVLFRDLWLCNIWRSNIIEALETSDEERVYLETEAGNWERYKLENICSMLSRLMPRTHYGMKSDVFSGLVLLEMQNIINGTAAENIRPHKQQINTAPQMPQNGGAYRRQADVTNKNATVNISALADKDRSTIKLDTSANISTDTKNEKRVPEDTCAVTNLIAMLGDNDFSRLVANLNGDAIEIASALLYAEIRENNGAVEIGFEQPIPAQTFLCIEQNRQNVIQAVSKLWGLNVQCDEKTEEKKSEMTAPQKENKDTAKPDAAKNKIQNEKDTNDKTAAVSADISRVLRLAGAEVLYVKSAAGDDESAEETEETAE